MFVRYDEVSRNHVEDRQMLVDTANGQKVPLALLATCESKGPNIINRENVQRRIVVQANVSGRDLGAVVTEIQKKITEKVHLPTGFFISYEGQFQSQQEATRLIGILSIVTLATMFPSSSFTLPLDDDCWQILLNIPLAFIGGLALTYFMVGKVSIATLVGLITLAGIASRNTIMMISHYIHLMEHEGEKFDEKMIVRGSLERLVPVTMTAAVAGLALIPLVLAAGQPGKEILYPVAVVILGGLISSTLLDMAVTPAVFSNSAAKRRRNTSSATRPIHWMPSLALPGTAQMIFPTSQTRRRRHVGGNRCCVRCWRSNHERKITKIKHYWRWGFAPPSV